jgi:acyl-CoA thioesterase-1
MMEATPVAGRARGAHASKVLIAAALALQAGGGPGATAEVPRPNRVGAAPEPSHGDRRRMAERGPPPGRLAAPPVLSALGDSTAVGARAGSYVDRLLARIAKAGRTFRLLNLAESGATTADVLRDQVRGVAKGQTGLVLVGVGANDLTSNVSLELFAQRFEAIIAGIRARTDAPIVVSNLPDISLASAVWPELRPTLAARVDAFNSVIARVARRHDLPVFDVCAMTRRSLPGHPEYLSADGFHPSDQGYEAWADGLWQIVQRLL